MTSTPEEKQKIIELIVKMSALTKEDSGAFQGEISAASAKIQMLMDKHAITWNDVRSVEADKQQKEMEDIFEAKTSDYVHKKAMKWHWRLAKLISRVTHTRYYLSGFGSFVFFGASENATIASALYTLWISNITTMADRALKDHKNAMLREFGDRKNFFSSLPQDLQPRYYRNSWIDGCIDGMNTNVTTQEASRPKEVENGIVLYNRDITERYKEYTANFNFKKVNPGGSNGFSNAGYSKGKEAGSNISIGSKSVSSGKKMLTG